jgi:hypothetical protein
MIVPAWAAASCKENPCSTSSKERKVMLKKALDEKQNKRKHTGHIRELFRTLNLASNNRLKEKTCKGRQHIKRFLLRIQTRWIIFGFQGDAALWH